VGWDTQQRQGQRDAAEMHHAGLGRTSTRAS